MKKLLPILLLTACTTETPTNQVINSTQQAIENLSQQVSVLPKECNSNAIKMQLSAINAQVKTLYTTCEAEKAPLKKDITIWKLISFSLAAALGLLIYAKIKKFII